LIGMRGGGFLVRAKGLPYTALILKSQH
jgi:hypothetical protein